MRSFYNRPAGLKGIPESTVYRQKATKSLAKMYANDRAGCCVISGKMHALGVWSANDLGAEKQLISTDTEVLEQYRSICGPGDNGCYINAVLDHMVETGLKVAGKPHKIDGYVAVDAFDPAMVKTAIHLFGGVTLGIELPSDWLNTRDGELWDVTSSRSVGGHDVQGVDYVKEGVIVSTWGRLNCITWAALESKRYVDECYAVLAPSWYNDDRLTPSGVDVEGLKKALEDFAAGVLPDPPEPPPLPPPVPVPPPPVYWYPTYRITGSVTPGSGLLSGEPITLDLKVKPEPPIVNHWDEPRGKIDWAKFLELLITYLPLIIDMFNQGKTVQEVKAIIERRLRADLDQLT